MSDIQRRLSAHMTRRQREQRALRLIIAAGVSCTLGAVGLVLAIFGVVGAGIPILLLVLAAVCGLLLRRALAR